jgi:acetyl esterase/lipase
MTNEFVRVASRIVAVILLGLVASLAQAQDRKEKRSAEDFNMAAYLAQLSSKAKQRGYKEYVYKQTPQGELRIYFAMPKDWSPNDCRPAVVFFYGGGWGSGNVFSFDEQSEYLAKCGCVAGMADYRVRTRHGVTPDKCVEDARSAVRWVRANCRKLGVDPHRVIAGGGSAGGHIAACTALLDAPNSNTDDLKVSCIPNGLMLCFPVASLVDDFRAEAFKQVLGEELSLKLSPARQVTKAWPPTILFFGNADRLLPNGILLYNQVREAGVVCELYLAEGQGHGFVNIEPWNYVSSKYAADFFMRAGILDKAPLPEAPPGELKKYNGEPIEKVYVKTQGNPTRMLLKSRGGKTTTEEPMPPKP